MLQLKLKNEQKKWPKYNSRILYVTRSRLMHLFAIRFNTRFEYKERQHYSNNKNTTVVGFKPKALRSAPLY